MNKILGNFFLKTILKKKAIFLICDNSLWKFMVHLPGLHFSKYHQYYSQQQSCGIQFSWSCTGRRSAEHIHTPGLQNWLRISGKWTCIQNSDCWPPEKPNTFAEFGLDPPSTQKLQVKAQLFQLFYHLRGSLLWSRVVVCIRTFPIKGLWAIKYFGLLIITASLMVKLTLHSDSYYIYFFTAKLFSLLNITLTGGCITRLVSANFFNCLPNLPHPLQPVNFPYIFLN